MNNGPSYRFNLRYIFVISILVLITLALIGRMVFLTLYDRSFLQQQGDARTMRLVSMPAYRGMILDRNGEPLAVSVPVESIWVNPKQFNFEDEKLPQLLKILHSTKASLRAKINDNSQREFLYLKRQVDPKVAQNIMNLHLPGLYALSEYKRFYPQSEVFAPLIGFTNVDDVGQEGVELGFNSSLQGVPGKEQVVRDLYGHVVETKGVILPPKPGKNLNLSVDSHIQYLAYSALKAAVTEDKAISGNIVILKVDTGEIIAMANYPSYNPNNRPTGKNSAYRNHTITDVFEPGSTTKTFAVVNALSSGKFKPDTKVDTSPGWMYLNGKRVEDEHDNGIIDITTILQRSSNVGITQLTLALPATSLWQLLNQIGYGVKTDSELPGEVNGSLVNRKKWSPFTLATLSFGYGLSVTTLQLAQAYATLANQGVKQPVSIVKTFEPAAGKQIIKPDVAKEVVQMLESVVSAQGTANAARIPGYTVSGKTGTVRMLGNHQYLKNHHTSIFVGMVPASHPQYIAAIVINDPQNGKYLGGSIAAPVFSTVMSGLLRVYNIPPDAPETLKVARVN